MENKIINRLKEIRDNLNLSQEGMAELVGTKPRTWQRYESGENIPKGQYLAILADNGYDINWLLTGKGIMKRPETPPSIEDVFADSLFIDVTEWGIAWAQKNKFEIIPENFGRMLIKCYDTVLQEKKRNPSSSTTELRRFLESFLEVAILLNR